MRCSRDETCGLVAAIALVGILAGLLSAIPDGVVLGQVTASSLTATPAATQVPDAPALFEDDFSTYSRRWLERESPKGQVAYRDGRLMMRVVSPGVSVWSVPDFEMPRGPYTLRITLVFGEGGPDSQAGCLVAVSDSPSFLAFVVAQSGAWQFQRMADGAWETIAEGSVQRDSEQRTLLLRVDSDGDTYGLWIDGQIAAQVVLESVSPDNGFGLMARAGRGWVEVAFEHVEVNQLAVGTDVVSDESNE